MTTSETTAPDPSLARAKASLIGANFFIETNRFEPLMAVYLIEFHAWDVTWVGYVSIAMNLLMLVLQTPAGDLMDKTRHKKIVTAGAVLTASLTTAAIAWKTDLWFVLLTKALEGVAATVFLPALISLLLGIVEADEVPRMVSLTETSNKVGSILFTVGCGLLSYYSYPDVGYIFYLLGAGGLAATCFVLAIPGRTIDHDRARGLNTREEEQIEASARVLGDGSREGSGARRRSSLQIFVKEPPSRYVELLRDRNVAVFAVLTFFYHLFNAALLPLLAQLIAQEDPRSGLAFTSGVMCLAYFVQAPVSYLVGLHYKKFGYKKLLMVGMAILPLRCLNLALFAVFWPNRYGLAATQIWDGMSAGIYDTLLPLVVQALIGGSGRFGFTFGFVVTCWRLGHGLSILVAESILKAAEHRYEAPFFACMAGGVAVWLLLAFGVRIPDPGEEEETVGPGAEAENAGQERERVIRTSMARRMSSI